MWTTIIRIITVIWRWLSISKSTSHKYRTKLTRKAEDNSKHYATNRKKPDWVIDKVIYLKAMMPNHGCGAIATTFNPTYMNKGETVSKTFVYEKLKANQYAVKVLRRKLKHKKPKPMTVNQTWGMDFTKVTLNGKQHLVLGVLDHGSRALLKLQAMESKSSATILHQLIETFRLFGLPKNIRTDNEICFNSRLINLSLLLLGIKKQTTDLACPWQNGRIERAFGSFKRMWHQVVFPTTAVIQYELATYQTWYNDIRPHSNLGGRTPKELMLNKATVGKAKFVRAWDGILSGFYFPD